MATSKKQIEANRRNAKKSTGPKSDQGKKISSKNAIKHGLYSPDIVIQSAAFSEDYEEYDALVNSLTEELKPEGQLQRHLVTKIANTVWRSQRVIRAETAHINARMDSIPEDIENAALIKRLRTRSSQREDYALTDEELQRAHETSLGQKSIPDDDTSRYILRCEMRLDRQLSRAYRLLERLQSKRAKSQAKSKPAKRNEKLPPGVSYVD